MISFSLKKKLFGANGEMCLDLNGKVEPGQIIAIYGPSGAGKTSLLRMLAGLLNPDDGHLTVNGVAWYDSNKKINLKPQRRSAGMVFQDYALFPNMSVRENLSYAQSNPPENKRFEEVSEVTAISGILDRRPGELSGGQKQRVALARALMRQPQILLLDEPLAATDQALRIQLQEYLLSLHRKNNLTTFLVSHDIGEILRLCGKVFHITYGKLNAEGTPSELFTNFKVSGKFQFTGEITSINREDVVYVVTVLIGNTQVRVIADEKEINSLDVGDQVMVASKAFNPIIKKLAAQLL